MKLEEYLEKLNVLNEMAGLECVSIFGDFDELEILKQSRSIRDAWEVGRELSALISECTSFDR